ncbi:hypothetical protein DICPUDRAFT_156353 [Dictyostelium purpureum]|uniref:EGF-like domain-containing protein n=1 Tax=Dictyostelium purpureum TaxID=5786 RepID=F0ZWC9_DICPU|nr:uncharacterized protein DICPUDRAFT_156353 [Dictyostelium purpureum]EGC31749.1 hypothetical protein DICPUDRAFT_156353 [Dictyostelium purpureum]|eukprot:XP_003291729.1 hypothetical protein DICPUDRAFT_156353 [Dictyostelium purpureum]
MKIILIFSFIFLNLIYICNNSLFVASQDIKLINGSTESNLVYTSSSTCILVVDIEIPPNSEIEVSPSGFALTPNQKEERLYRVNANNLPIGSGVISLTITPGPTIFEIGYSCKSIEFSKLQYKIISKLFYHHSSYKATFQIIGSIIPNIELSVIEYNCNGGTNCKLNKINDNTFDIVFFEIPKAYKNDWVLQLGLSNPYNLILESPYKGSGSLTYGSYTTPPKEFNCSSQTQLPVFYFEVGYEHQNFYIPPAFSFSYTQANDTDIVRKPKIQYIDGFDYFLFKTVERPNEDSFSLAYFLDSYSFEVSQTTQFVQNNLNNYITSFYLGSIKNQNMDFQMDSPYAITYSSPSSAFYNIKVSVPFYKGSNYPINFLSNDSLFIIVTGVPNIDWVTLDQSYFMLRVSVSDSNGLRLLRLTPNSYGNTMLAQGTLQNGIFEFKFSYLDSFIDFQSQSLILLVSNGIEEFEQSIQYNEVLKLSPFSRFLADPLLESLKGFDMLSNIKKISFLNNKMNVTNNDGWNLMFLEFKDGVQNYEPMLSVIKDVTEQSYFHKTFDSSDLNIQNYYGQWNRDYSLYIIEFFIPRNIIAGFLSYSLSITYNKYSIVYNQDLPSEYQLTIVSSKTDFQGPIIKNLIMKLLPGQDYDFIVWNITISDSINGFKDGYILVRSLNDYSKYNYTLSKDTIIVGDIYEGLHQIKVQVPATSCGQTPDSFNIFQIFEVFFRDSGDNLSHFKIQGKINKLAYTDPFSFNITLLYNLSYQYICTLKPTDDPISPSIMSLDVSAYSINVFSTNRKLQFNLHAECQSTINIYSPPTIYLSSFLNPNIIQVPLSLVNCTDPSNKVCFFTGIYEVSLGFGYPDGILYSLYGLSSGRGTMVGKTSGEIGKYIVTSNSTLTSPLITSTGKITSNGGSLRIDGIVLHNAKSVLVSYSDRSSQIIAPSKIFSTSLIIPNIKPTKSAFTIKITSSNGEQSNTFTVSPTISIDIPPNPQKPTVTCKKDSSGNICGGNTKGECINNQCICKSPWIGSDCSSKIIVIPKPEPSLEEPSTTILVDEEDDVLKSIISVVQLRELDYQSEPVKKYQFEIWHRTNLSSSAYQYISNITNNKINTIVNVTLQWFESAATINFANQVVEMNPSSLKYTITIGEYGFESTLNSLQLVMLSTVKSNIDDCSYKEFNNQTSDDYLRLKIRGKSLYGRFIKRAVLDETKIISISNQILDKDMDSADNENSLQSFIGINIPYFQFSAVIDPDYSVIVDHSANNDGDTFCSSGKKGLTSLNIVGITLGCFFFVVACGICYLYYRNKVQRRKEFLEKLKQSEMTMLELETNSNNTITIDLEKH